MDVCGLWWLMCEISHTVTKPPERISAGFCDDHAIHYSALQCNEYHGSGPQASMGQRPLFPAHSISKYTQNSNRLHNEIIGHFRS